VRAVLITKQKKDAPLRMAAGKEELRKLAHEKSLVWGADDLSRFWRCGTIAAKRGEQEGKESLYRDQTAWRVCGGQTMFFGT